MKKGLTELVFIIDKSASMGGLEEETLRGFNSMLEEQQSLDGEAIVTTFLFDAHCTLLHDRINIQAVEPLTREDYSIGRGTAMLDAIGMAMHKIREAQRMTKEDYRAEKVLFIIITDGEENSSRYYTSDMIGERIRRHKKNGWEFVLFGANINAAAYAAKLGINADHAHNYYSDPHGLQMAYSAMSAVSSKFRTTGSAEIPESDNAEDAINNMKNAMHGLKDAADEMTDEFMQLNRAAEANGGKIPDINEIMRNIFRGYDE